MANGGIKTLEDALKAVAQVGPVAREYCQKAEDGASPSRGSRRRHRRGGLVGCVRAQGSGRRRPHGVGRAIRDRPPMAYEDSSAGWSMFICGTSTALLAAKLADPARSEIFAGGLRPMAGVFNPGGSSQIVDGGVKVSGRWPFASGVGHAAYVMANTILLDESGAPSTGRRRPARDPLRRGPDRGSHARRRLACRRSPRHRLDERSRCKTTSSPNRGRSRFFGRRDGDERPEVPRPALHVARAQLRRAGRGYGRAGPRRSHRRTSDPRRTTDIPAGVGRPGQPVGRRPHRGGHTWRPRGVALDVPGRSTSAWRTARTSPGCR